MNRKYTMAGDVTGDVTGEEEGLERGRAQRSEHAACTRVRGRGSDKLPVLHL